MKTISFKFYSLGAGMMLMMILAAYWMKAHSADNAFVIPQLLDRNERIMLGNEWDEVQRQYVGLRNQLEANTHDHKAATALAYLFIKEARVTGEHGHYYPAAQTVLDHMLGSKKLDNENRFNALVTKAGVQLSLHDFKEALKTAQMALSLNPYNAQIYGVLVDCHVELGQYQKAVSLADQMVNIRPDLRSYSRVSYLREIFGDIDGAKKAMLMAIQAGYPGQEETAWAMHTYAEMLMRYGYDQEARLVYESILQERPNYPFAIAGLGKLAIKSNDFKEAESRLKDAIDIVPEVDFYVTLAELYKKQHKEALCDKLKSEILDMLADDTRTGHNMDLEYAHVYSSLFDDTKTALIYAGKELKKRPLNIDVNRTMAMLEVANKDLINARLHYAAATTTQSKHPDLEFIKTRI